MTPVAFLVGFCAAMAAIAIGRLVIDENRTRIDVGAALTIIGLTFVSASWATLDASMLSTIGRLSLALVGLGICAVGVIVLARFWNDPSRRPSPRD
ncbi:hypothetical protein [Natronolimnohabitans innermongolicus]|uniref:Uncharacterized protein n=1 Tax=Natronolimnohabitans innermongolicus JCM 12255 TaxID=1227499 RepID=L9XDP5_9EURY|nr:hypothetical protein [Natronolimnohabitans innermongolicus]ELY58753.1 hypothetical protein C493_06282 [Natronolimnohabitans innermongolicus JCM 12255]